MKKSNTKKIVAVALSILLAGLFCVSCERRKSGSEMFEKGNRLAAEGDYISAVDAWLGAAALDYQPSEAHCQAGIAYEEQLNNLNIAIWHYRQAKILAQPDTPSAVQAEIRLDMALRSAAKNARISGEAAAKLSEKDAIITILENRCEELSRWVKRLNDENLALREMLIECKSQAK